ncbi:antiterminator Q family protein [Thorsellia kenyensis]|uniref:Antiterminator Q family protein n=1 Tax=Thorsellia kenyensis TaxID=1549888 RepID=A0ABV6C9S0_9GAMM
MEKLTPEQTQEIENLMETWGAWVYSGRLEKREVSMLGQLMARVNPQKYQNRPMCDDDTGLLIDEIMQEIKIESEPAFEFLVNYYVYLASNTQVAIRYYRKTDKSGKRPCLRTYYYVANRVLDEYRLKIHKRFNQLKSLQKTG